MSIFNQPEAPQQQQVNAMTERVIGALRGTKPWVQFLSVMIWIGAIFMILAGLLMMVFGMAGPAMAQSEPLNIPEIYEPDYSSAGFAASAPMGGGINFIIGLVYMALALLYIYPATRLWKYGDRIGKLITTRDVVCLEDALEAQRSFWKFVGVITLIMIVLQVMAFGFAVVGGIVAAAR